MGDVRAQKLLRKSTDATYPVWAIFIVGNFKKPELLIEELEMQHLIRTYLTDHPRGRKWVAAFLKELEGGKKKR